MKLFAPDLYRSFVIGFLGAAVVLSAGLVEGIDGFGTEIVPEARAAETLRPANDDVMVDPEFLIPEDIGETS